MARKKAGATKAAKKTGRANGTEKTPNVRADHQSIAIGDIYIGRDLSGNFTIGYTAEQVSLLLDQFTTRYQPKPFDGRCPYKGLDVFEEEDADLFFGRERLVDDLIQRVQESRTLFITGPSGSGKSSLVRAGLIPALKQGAIKELHSERWVYETIKPGREPIKELSLAFSRLKSPELSNYFQAHANEANILNECAESVLSGRKDQRLVLFVDQFEEVFTQVHQQEERLAFLNMLTHAGTVENGRVIVLFALRSDFISNCAAYPALNELLSQQFRQIGAMYPEELVSAIALPAKSVGLPIEDELVARIINDMKGEPGALPLMQFALKDLFDSQQAKGGTIAFTLEEYLRHGGIQKSLERHADATLVALPEEAQKLAHSIFSGLIEIGRGNQDTKRTALFDELVPANTDSEDVLAVVRKLADARLVITDEQAGQDTVTISHEKLIDAWPWLKRLVNENREIIALQNQISADAREWQEHHRDKSYLYSGARLLNVLEKLKSKSLILSGDASHFIRIARSQQKRGRVGAIATALVILTLALMTLVLSTPLALEKTAQSRAREGMSLIVIPAGQAIFGTNNAEAIAPGVLPAQSVYLPGFQISKYEVTNYQFGLCVKYGTCIIPLEQTAFRDPTKQEHPVVYVSLYQANAYCRWVGLRLPTQVEWERAARGPNGDPWPWGNSDPQPDLTNMPLGPEPALGTQPVDSNPKGVSPEGVYNLVGNVWEFTTSNIKPDGNFDLTYFWDGSIETFRGTDYYATRGGGWAYGIREISESSANTGSDVRSDVGFRCAASLR